MENKKIAQGNMQMKRDKERDAGKSGIHRDIEEEEEEEKVRRFKNLFLRQGRCIV